MLVSIDNLTNKTGHLHVATQTNSPFERRATLRDTKIKSQK